MEPRELALREVRAKPWLQQRELAARLAAQTGLAEATLIRMFGRMEAEGQLRSGLDGRRKTYALPEPARTAPPEPARTAPPTQGALWSDRLARLGERDPHAEQEPEPETREREPVATKPAWPIAVVVAVVLAVSVLAAVILSPEKHDPLTGAETDSESR